MSSELFQTLHRARFSGIRIVPENSPSLQHSCVRAFVESVVQSKQNGGRILELQFLPAIMLTDIFDRLCNYPQLREIIRNELVDPVQFLKLFNGRAAGTRQTIARCLREASLSDKPQVLKDLTGNYCDMVRAECHQGAATMSEEQLLSRLLTSLRFGSFLYDAGWCKCSVDVLTQAQDLLGRLSLGRRRPALELDCLVLLLRAQLGSCMTSKASVTVEKLLTFVGAEGAVATTSTTATTGAGIPPSALVKAFLQLGHYYYQVQNFDRCHFWALKAMTAITDDDGTVADDIIDVLQLIALFCIAKQRYDLGNMLICQAVQRARHEHGSLDRKYADVLQNYGFVLLKMNAVPQAVTVLTESLDITIRRYGPHNPHVAVLEGYLAYGLYLRSYATDRFDMALRHIDNALGLVRLLMPGSRLVLRQLEHTRGLILKGRDASRPTKESQPTSEREYQHFTLTEIKEKFFELDSTFEREAALVA